MPFEVPSLPEVSITIAGLECELIDYVTDVEWESQWGQDSGGGGSWELSFSMPNLDPNFNHPSFDLGKPVSAKVGSWNVFAGRLSAIDKGAPWKFSASGYVQYVKDFVAIGPTGSVTSKPDDLIDRMISADPNMNIRRLTSFGGLGNPSYFPTDATAGINRVDGILNGVTSAAGMRWGINAQRIIYAQADPTVPTWHLMPDAAIVGVLDTEFYTDLYGRAIAGLSSDASVTDFDFQDDKYKYLTAHVSDPRGKMLTGETREYGIDLRALGPLVTAVPAGNAARGVAEGLLGQRLPLVAARVGFTNSITANWWEVQTPGGLPMPLWMVNAGDLGRVHGVTGDDGNLKFGTSVDLVGSRVKYRAGDSKIQIDPLGLAPRDFAAALADATADPPAQKPSGINPAFDGWAIAS